MDCIGESDLEWIPPMYIYVDHRYIVQTIGEAIMSMTSSIYIEAKYEFVGLILIYKCGV